MTIEGFRPSPVEASAEITFKLALFFWNTISFLNTFRDFFLGSSCRANALAASKSICACSLEFAAIITLEAGSPSAIKEKRPNAAANVVFPFFLLTEM